MVTFAGPGVPSAEAHFCATPVELKVGLRAVVNIGVAAEEKPITGVDVTVPSGFHLEDPIGYLGWIGTATGNVVHFQGAVMQPYTCTFFSLDGTATKKGRLVLPILTHAEDGTSRHYASTQPFNPYAAQVIYAGIPIPTQTVTPGGNGGLPSGFFPALGIAVLAGALVVGAAVMVNRRRPAG